MMTWAESRPVRTFLAESQQQPQLRMRENRVCVCKGIQLFSIN